MPEPEVAASGAHRPLPADRQLRLAVVGAGWMGVAHLRAYAARPDVADAQCREQKVGGEYMGRIW